VWWLTGKGNWDKETRAFTLSRQDAQAWVGTPGCINDVLMRVASIIIHRFGNTPPPLTNYSLRGCTTKAFKGHSRCRLSFIHATTM